MKSKQLYHAVLHIEDLTQEQKTPKYVSVNYHVEQKDDNGILEAPVVLVDSVMLVYKNAEITILDDNNIHLEAIGYSRNYGLGTYPIKVVLYDDKIKVIFR